MKTKQKQNDIQYEYIKTHTGKIRDISTESTNYVNMFTIKFRSAL